MGFFETKKEKDLHSLRRIIIKRLLDEYSRELNPNKRRFIEAMARSVAFTPIEVFPGKRVLQEGIERRGGLFSFFQVRGQSLVEFMELITGNKKQVLVRNKIQVPELWEKNSFIPQRVMTLLHEFGHNAKLHAGVTGLTERQEEQLADTLAVYTAKKLGFSREIILLSLEGRAPIIGEQYHTMLLQEARKAKAKPSNGKSRVFPRNLVRIIPIKPPQKKFVRRSSGKMPTMSFSTSFARTSKKPFHRKMAA